MATAIITPQTPLGNSISKPNRLQACGPVEVTESGPRPSRRSQHQNAAQVSAATAKNKTVARALRDVERNNQTTALTAAKIINQKIRYFGWLHPRALKRLLIVQTLLEAALVFKPKPEPEGAGNTPFHLRCERCQRPALIIIGGLPRARSP